MSAQAHPSLGSGRYGQCVMEFAKVKPYTKSNDMLAKGEENDFAVRPLEKYSTQYFRVRSAATTGNAACNAGTC